MRANTLLSLILCPFTLAACGTQTDYDPATLDSFRSAIPSENRLQLDKPDDSAGRAGNAVIANFGANLEPLNRTISDLVANLKVWTDTEPTLFNSDTREFVWGPADADGYGQFVLYIRENTEDDADFEYGYALARTTEDGDLANLEPVIWGGATPDPDDEDRGVGITLFDYDANNAFLEANDPDFDAALPRTTGRFAAVYGHVEDDPASGAADLAFNYAVFRNFRGEDDTSGQDINLDVFYGKYTAQDGDSLAFLDWEQTADICDGSLSCFENAGGGTDTENLSIAMAFFNEGVGRGEVTISGGNLGTTEIYADECWDAAVDQTMFEMADNNNGDYSAINVDAPGCIGVFSANLDDLEIPSLDVIETEHRQNMACVALHGVADCQACIEDSGTEACSQ